MATRQEARTLTTPAELVEELRKLLKELLEAILFDHRLDEMLEVLKAILEYEVVREYFAFTERDFTISPGADLKVLEIAGGGGLLHTIASVEMPDATPPEVCFVVIHDGRETEDFTVKGYYDLGLNSPNEFGWTTVYDTSNRLYAWIVPWNLTVRESLVVYLRNKTDKNVSVKTLTIDGYVRPYARYFKPKIR